MLSMFSFAKYLMWKDLSDRTEDLRKSPVVAHLIDSPREPYPSTTPFPETRRLDIDYPPQQVFSPLPADSSQLSAVMAAARGKDFVLIGPPGTGKSQTIANLIAQCLAENKRVLFVQKRSLRWMSSSAVCAKWGWGSFASNCIQTRVASSTC